MIITIAAIIYKEATLKTLKLVLQFGFKMLLTAKPKSKTANNIKTLTNPHSIPNTNAPNAKAIDDSIVDKAIIKRVFLNPYFEAKVGIFALL